MNQTTQLASGHITNHDEITVILIEPTDGIHHWFACIGRYAPQQPRPRVTLLWRRRSSGSSPRVRRHWHGTRREDYEQRSQSVRAVRGRSPHSRGVRAVGLVGGAQLDLCHVRLASPQPSRRAPGNFSPGLCHPCRAGNASVSNNNSILLDRTTSQQRFKHLLAPASGLMGRAVLYPAALLGWYGPGGVGRGCPSLVAKHAGFPNLLRINSTQDYGFWPYGCAGGFGSRCTRSRAHMRRWCRVRGRPGGLPSVQLLAFHLYLQAGVRDHPRSV